MQERTLLRIGAVWLIAGVVLFHVALFVSIGLIHGGPLTPATPGLIFRR